MNKEHKKLLTEVYTLLDDIENGDETIRDLQQGAEYWCSNYDLCEGYKHAMILCLQDQYNNHAHEQDIESLQKLKDLLTGTVVDDDKKLHEKEDHEDLIKYYKENNPEHTPVFCVHCNKEADYWNSDDDYLCADCACEEAELTEFTSGGKLDGWEDIGSYACCVKCRVCNCNN